LKYTTFALVFLIVIDPTQWSAYTPATDK